ncbi:hypothetical protein FLP41_15020 [Paracoccus marcusii]|uniref:hypothetical protein n=1 Tax=Paracoccus marcusii TaxID=59779 RepID=UPI002ED19933|nr:hypothetical protein FLP41_15020 [Paracoccus marcusii]
MIEDRPAVFEREGVALVALPLGLLAAQAGGIDPGDEGDPSDPADLRTCLTISKDRLTVAADNPTRAGAETSPPPGSRTRGVRAFSHSCRGISAAEKEPPETREMTLSYGAHVSLIDGFDEEPRDGSDLDLLRAADTVGALLRDEAINDLSDVGVEAGGRGRQSGRTRLRVRRDRGDAESCEGRFFSGGLDQRASHVIRADALAESPVLLNGEDRRDATRFIQLVSQSGN